MSHSPLAEQLSSTIFTEAVWGRDVAHINVAHLQMMELVTWQEINHVLGRYAIPSPRLRMAREGRLISPSVYQMRSHGGAGLLKTSIIEELIGQGVTLILDGVDDLFSRVRPLVATCEELITSKVSANLYASFGYDSGFGVHSDTSHGIILQLQGSKRWTVWQAADSGSNRQQQEPPHKETAIAWDGILSAGELLYVPYGWWHNVQPNESLSLHVTLTIPPVSQYSFLTWLIERVRSEVSLQDQLPIRGGDCGRQAIWARSAVERLTELYEESFLDQFLSQHQDSRSDVALPYSVANE